MGRSRLSLKRSLLLSAVFSLSLFTAGVLADTTTDVATTADAATTTADAATTTAEAATTTEAATTSDAATTSSTSDDATTTTSDMPTESASTTSDDSTTSASDTAASDMPSLSSTTSADTSIPTYPAPTVPPKDNAPYLQTSNLPDGTVFICVGAILGSAFLAVLLWRGIVACLLHRSVEKAAMEQHLANDKASFPIPPGPFYKYSDQDSSQNIASGRGVRRTTRGAVPSATPSQSNLFFSPTAGATNRDSVYRDEPNRNSSYRDSRFLPAGFYAAGAGASSPGYTDGHDQSISLTNLRPDSRGHALSGHSPPESPAFGPQRARHSHNMSTSSVNLNNSQTRAPSAFLDDLLDEHPEAFPPSGPSPDRRSHANHPYRQSGGRF